MWAFQFSGAKIATEQLGPVAVALLPLAIATILLIPPLVVAKRNGAGQDNRAARGKHAIRNFILLALLGSTPAQVCLTFGVKRSLAADASVLTLTIPVLTAIMAVILLGEKMTGLRWVSFAMAIAGVLLVSDIDWKSLQLFHGTYLAGNLLIFGSCLGSAFYNSFSKKLLESFNPVEVLVYSFIVTDIVLFALMLLFESGDWRTLATLDAPVWLSLVLIGLFSLAVSMILFFWVIQRIDVTQASLSIYLLPVFGVLISALTLHEKTTVHLIVGGVLVFVSTFLVTTYEERLKTKVQKN